MPDLQPAGSASESPAAPQIAAGTVVNTRKEAAKLLGVSVRQFAEWMTDPGFPGRPGKAGERAGYFPIEQIRAWQAGRFGADGRSKKFDDEEIKIRREMIGIDRDRKLAELERDTLGTLIDADEVTNFVTFVISNSKQILQELPDRILARLPSKTPRVIQKVIRRTASQVTREVLENLAQMIIGDADAKDDVD